MPPDKPRCSATTKKGTACKANPVLGTDRCMAHQDEEAKESKGFGGAQPGSGRPRKPSSSEFLWEQFQAVAPDLQKVLVDGLSAERSVVVGNGPSAYVESVADPAERLKYAKEWLDRVFGRPRQEVEISASEIDGMGAVIITDPELQEAARELLHRAAQAAGEDESGGAGGGDQ